MNNTKHITEFPDDASYTLTGAQLNLLLARYHNVAINTFANRLNGVARFDDSQKEDQVLYQALITAIRERGEFNAEI